jgi:hypothetical protein
VSNLSGWFRDNQALAIALIVQAIIGGAYIVTLESRVSTLEVRGSPHLGLIDNRLTVLESQTKDNKESIERIKDVLLKNGLKP